MSKRLKAWIGIDPGKQGSMCIIDEDGIIKFMDWPKNDDKMYVYKRLKNLSLHYDIQLAALEFVNAGAVKGRLAAFSFGGNFHTWDTLLLVLGIPYVIPKPSDWQKGIINKKDGANSKQRAKRAIQRELGSRWEVMQWSVFHTPKKRYLDGRVDAYLIAKYAKQRG